MLLLLYGFVFQSVPFWQFGNELHPPPNPQPYVVPIGVAALYSPRLLLNLDANAPPWWEPKLRASAKA